MGGEGRIMAVEKTRNNGTLTEAAFKALIVSGLRDKSRWWKPKQMCIRKARVSKGMYKCAICEQVVHGAVWGVYKSGKKEGKKRKIVNILADHIDPVVDPHVGFQSWDTYIERMFVEEIGYQAACHSCHSGKTKIERDIATQRKRNENSKV